MPLKYKTVAEDLQRQITSGELARGQQLPPEFEIAKAYDVSRQTVRQALGVLVQDGLIEKRHGSGSYVKSEPEARSGIRRVAVVTTYISDYIFPSILREVETTLAKNHCTPSLFATQNQVANEREVLKNLLVQRFDGVLVEGTKTALPNPNIDLYEQIADRNIPLVFINGNYPQLQNSIYVLDDNFAGGRQLVEHLVSKGHERIAGFFKSDDIQGHERYAGYVAGLKEARLPIEDKWIFWYDTQSKNMMLNPDDVLLPRLLKAAAHCSAIVCYNDEVASHLITLLLKEGVRVPQDMAVVSFDNSHYCEMASVPITSLTHGRQNVGAVAAEKLIALMDGKYCEPQRIEWTLVERQSG